MQNAFASCLVVTANHSQQWATPRTDGVRLSSAYGFEVFSMIRRNLTLDAAPIPWSLGTG